MATLIRIVSGIGTIASLIPIEAIICKSQSTAEIKGSRSFAAGERGCRTETERVSLFQGWNSVPASAI
jgi:hypothetical protein